MVSIHEHRGGNPNPNPGPNPDPDPNPNPNQVRTLTGWLLHPNVGGCLVLQTEEDVAAAAAGHGLSYTSLKGEVERSGRAEQLASLNPNPYPNPNPNPLTLTLTLTLTLARCDQRGLGVIRLQRST